MNIVVLPISFWSRMTSSCMSRRISGIESAERLVVEHHLGVRCERSRDADALLHAARELVGELVRDVVEANQPEDLARPRVSFLLAHSLDLEAERDVVDHAPMCEEPEVLEDHRDRTAAQLTQLPAIGAHHVVACDLDLARGRLDEPDERAHQRRLARAGEAHDDEHLALPDLQRDVPDCDDVARLLAKLGPREEGVLGIRRAARGWVRRPSRCPSRG